MHKPILLIITSQTDSTTSFLEERLQGGPLSYFRFNTETFPQDWLSHWEIDSPDGPILNGPENLISLSSVAAVWHRRPLPPVPSATISHHNALNYTRRECEDALSCIWRYLDTQGATWVSAPHAIRLASRKTYQLQTAKKCNFLVPQTILTNDPNRALEFYKRHQRNVVFKTLHQEALSVGGANFFIFTNRLDDEHLHHIDSIRLAPLLFQRYIPPKLELRITVVGSRVFSAAIINQTPVPLIDWRRLLPTEQPWQPYDLPTSVERSCVDLVQSMGLNFGAIDMIVDQNDDYYFLEINPSGQWVWIELTAGLPIASALIEFFTRGSRT